MGIQSATTGNLENGQNVMIATYRYTAEHNDPNRNLIEHFTLPKGHKQITVPKVGSMDAQDLTDGVDLVDSEDIGMTTTDLTTAEVGLKVVLTKKLVDQASEDMFRVVGRQMGDAMSRKVDEDIIELFDGFSTTKGGDNKNLKLLNATGVVASAKAAKFPRPISFVHHPNAIAYCMQDLTGMTGSYFQGIMQGLPEELLRNFWKFQMDGVNFFEDGNISKVSGYDSGKGACFSKSALCIVEGWSPTVEREYDASLRGWEVVITSDYGVFELDDGYGFECQYEIGDLSTTE